MVSFRRKSSKTSKISEDTLLAEYPKSRPWGLRIFVSLLYLIALIFLILVEIGCINTENVIRDTYFLKIDVSNIVPTTVPNAVLINSLAQTIGLHDFYQVGLWGFCQGYNDVGVTSCSEPQTLYWFNPVEIILDQLLAGASITLPEELINILDLVKTVSQWMFGLFLVGTILTFLSIFLAPLAFSKQPRWNHRGRRIFFRNLPITVITFFAFLCTTVAAVIATVMFSIFVNVINNASDELNIEPTLGVRMLAFEWTAVGCLLIGFVMQIGTCCGICCCTGRKKALRKSQVVEVEK